ncbi:MAG: hypothetical protein BWZ10_01244 [candidate division BRC1 bacterium ADurb.BinA364]|nr:MAG: hypothetical protein BWZ10_01244 [candidate division BRC1 bacterium ADurb.BinA364]
MHVHVHARVDGLEHRVFLIFGDMMQRHEPLDVQPVADNEAVETHFAAQQVFHQAAVGMAGNAVEFVVGHHHRAASGAQAGGVGRQEDVAQRALRQVHRRGVDAVDRLAAGDHVLGAGPDRPRARGVRALIAASHRRAHLAGQQGVFAEGLADAPPAGVARHIDIRREGPVRAHGAHFERGLARHAFRQFGIERCGKADGCRIHRRAARQSVAVDRVDADQQRHAQSALGGQPLQRIGLPGAHDMQKRADQAPPRQFLDVVGGHAGIEAVGVALAHRAGGQARLGLAQVLRAHILAHLADFFFERHARKQIADAFANGFG